MTGSQKMPGRMSPLEIRSSRTDAPRQPCGGGRHSPSSVHLTGSSGDRRAEAMAITESLRRVRRVPGRNRRCTSEELRGPPRPPISPDANLLSDRQIRATSVGQVGPIEDAEVPELPFPGANTGVARRKRVLAAMRPAKTAWASKKIVQDSSLG